MGGSESGEHQPLARDELWRQLENAIALRSTQDQILWALFGVFWASNAILLVALFTTGTLPQDSTAGLIVATVGTFLCVAWTLIQRRALGHLVRAEKLMATFERSLRVDPSLAVSWDVNREAYDLHVGRGPRARHVMTACAVVGTGGWVAFGAYSAFRIFF